MSHTSPLTDDRISLLQNTFNRWKFGLAYNTLEKGHAWKIGGEDFHPASVSRKNIFRMLAAHKCNILDDKPKYIIQRRKMFIDDIINLLDYLDGNLLLQHRTNSLDGILKDQKISSLKQLRRDGKFIINTTTSDDIYHLANHDFVFFHLAKAPRDAYKKSGMYMLIQPNVGNLLKYAWLSSRDQLAIARGTCKTSARDDFYFGPHIALYLALHLYKFNFDYSRDSFSDIITLLFHEPEIKIPRQVPLIKHGHCFYQEDKPIETDETPVASKVTFESTSDHIINVDSESKPKEIREQILALKDKVAGSIVVLTKTDGSKLEKIIKLATPGAYCVYFEGETGGSYVRDIIESCIVDHGPASPS